MRLGTKTPDERAAVYDRLEWSIEDRFTTCTIKLDVSITKLTRRVRLQPSNRCFKAIDINVLFRCRDKSAYWERVCLSFLER